jgi:hypothetical protein
MIKRLVIFFLLLLPAFSWLLQPGYFPMHDDLQIARQLEMDACFHDGQIPCRWSKNLGYGFGYPLFNFYPPLPYLIGQIYRTFGLAYIDVVKAVGVTGFLLTFVFMYLLGEKLWGKKGGLISAVIYSYAPYHSVDFYVRGAMNEFWAMAVYPAIFLCLLLLVRTNRSRYVPLTALSIAALMLSHNPMLMIFAPVAVAWTLFWLWQEKTFKSLPKIILSGVWGFGLAAFFTLPVLLEQKFAHVETLTIGYFNFLAHFLDLNQIFFRINWGYGESILGSGDTMSFALGYLQWILPALALVFALAIKKFRRRLPLMLLLLLFTLTALFLSHSRSTPIWLKFKPLEFLQFPWRFLTVAVFSASLLSGAVAWLTFKRFSGKFVLILVLTLSLVLNANYFRPRTWYPEMTDADKFSGQSWRWQITGSIFDYLPVYAPLPPADPAGADLGITSGQGTFVTLLKNSYKQEYAVNIFTPTATAEIQTFYFPGWKVYLDGRRVDIDPARDPLLGRMQVDLTAGTHRLLAVFTATPVRRLGDLISLFSWSCLLLSPLGFYLLHRRRRAVNSPVIGV